ncbi:helix-turn-helix transcriptional regulator [Candidatus Saccharibacteria bacterium]|jgi:DNA-binding HxlR family transcriptional regulator|nr:helix-turn-helix transcriptional regulator [Candidatus Saccharibacteria bacterium]
MIEKCKSDCVGATANILGDKWTPLLVLSISKQAKTFTELEKDLEGISSRTLTKRLEFLVVEGIVLKKKYQDSPVRCNYSLSETGTGLHGCIVSMNEWGEKQRSIKNGDSSSSIQGH